MAEVLHSQTFSKEISAMCIVHKPKDACSLCHRLLLPPIFAGSAPRHHILAELSRRQMTPRSSYSSAHTRDREGRPSSFIL